MLPSIPQPIPSLTLPTPPPPPPRHPENREQRKITETDRKKRNQVLPKILEYASSTSPASSSSATMTIWCVRFGSRSRFSPIHSSGGVASPMSRSCGVSMTGCSRATYSYLDRGTLTSAVILFLAAACGSSCCCLEDCFDCCCCFSSIAGDNDNDD